MNKKNIIIGILIVVLVSLGYLYVRNENSEVVTEPNVSMNDSVGGDKQRNKNTNFEEIYVYESEVDGPDECTEFEDYNPENSTCFYECVDDQECKEIEDDINSELDGWATNYEGYKDHPEEGNQSDEDGIVATYRVKKGEQISLVSGKAKPEYEALWKEISELSPDNVSDNFIETFNVQNNKSTDSLAHVHDDDGNGKWSIAVNIANRSSLSDQEKKVTLIHELAHIITLNKTQVAPKTPCNTKQISEGCMKDDSYVYGFIKQFWAKKLPYSEKNYVTEYGASEDVEDLAESFAVFVIGKLETNPQSIADKKIAYFQKYPELLKMRDEMRSVLSRDIVRARKLKRS